MRFSSAKQGCRERSNVPAGSVGRRDDRPEIWCEKDAVTGVLVQETYPYDVALMPCRGYVSVTFLNSAAETILERDDNDRRTVIYYLGDQDPAGVDIDRHIVESIGRSLAELDGLR